MVNRDPNRNHCYHLLSDFVCVYRICSLSKISKINHEKIPNNRSTLLPSCYFFLNFSFQLNCIIVGQSVSIETDVAIYLVFLLPLSIITHEFSLIKLIVIEKQKKEKFSQLNLFIHYFFLFQLNISETQNNK